MSKGITDLINYFNSLGFNALHYPNQIHFVNKEKRIIFYLNNEIFEFFYNNSYIKTFTYEDIKNENF